jgi:hypothetical protein
VVIWVKAEAVGMPCDQRAELIGPVGGNLRVKLCGTGQEAIVAPAETCGFEPVPNMAIRYDVVSVRRSSR